MSTHGNTGLRRAFPRSRRKAMRLYEIVRTQPGISFRNLAAAVGMCPSRLEKTIPALESHGLLVYEDDAGRLYPFE